MTLSYRVGKLLSLLSGFVRRIYEFSFCFELCTKQRTNYKMANSGSATFQPDSDVHITFEDQQKINKFAKHNAKLEDLKEELKSKQNDLKNLDEACDELTFMDEYDEKVPYLMGEVFMYQNIENTQKTLEEAKTSATNEIKALELRCADIRNVMSDLKTQLYAKFGNHINLEAEDEE